MTGLLEWRTDACLLVADLLEGLLQFVHLLLVGKQTFERQSCLLHLSDDLWDRQVVGLSHEEGDEFVEGVVVLLGLRIVVQGIGHHHGFFHLVGIVHAEGYALQPHHTTEVALQCLIAGVVTTGTEKTVGKLNLLVVLHEVADVVLGFYGLLHLGLGLCLFLGGTDGLSRQQLISHSEEYGVMIGIGPDLLIIGIGCLLVHGIIHIARHLGHQFDERLFLDLLQQTVEIEMIEL